MNGYLPHAGQVAFRCGRCGGERFKSFAQTVPADRNQAWTFEYVCADCGQIMGLSIVSGGR